MQHAQYSRGHFALIGYERTAVVAMHTLTSVPHLREQLTFPKAERDARTRLASSANMARSWHSALPPSLYQFYSSETLVVDVLSPLLGIISPPIKPAAIHLLATEDRKVIGPNWTLHSCNGTQLRPNHTQIYPNSF